MKRFPFARAGPFARARSPVDPLVPGASILLAAVIFYFDAMTAQPLAVAVLYVVVILGVATMEKRRWVLWGAAACIGLTILGYMIAHRAGGTMQPALACLVSIAAIIAAAHYTLRNLAAAKMQRYQTKLLDQTHDSVSVRSLDGSLTYWNQGAIDLYGWTLEEARGLTAQAVLRTTTPLPGGGIDDFIRKGAWEGEVVAFAKDGRELIIECRCSLLYDDRGRPAGILTTGNDVTLRRRADQALRRSEARYRNIFQTTSVSIWECDFSRVRHRIGELHAGGMRDFRQYLRDHPDFVREAIDLTVALDVNEASVRLFGARDRAELLGPVGQVWPLEGEKVFAESMVAALEQRASFETEAVLQTVDGKRLDLLFTVAFPSEASLRESIFVAVADITARNRTQAALHQAQVDLAHATRITSLGELTASIAHEVSQPLAGIISNGQAGLRWLQREKPNLAEVASSLENLVDQAKRAGAVIDRVRALARKEQPRLEAVDLNQVVAESIQLLDRELSRNDIVLQQFLAHPLDIVRADRIQIQQVVINLMMNAIQAMAGVVDQPRTLRVTSYVEDGHAIVAVSDVGPGIDPTLRDRLFTAFFTTKTNGMGMGLSVSGSIIDQHGGKIWVTGNGGRGATFRFSLPTISGDGPAAAILPAPIR